MNRNLILYFVKYPEPGKVKTRLAKTIGDEAAAKCYGNLAEHNFRILAPLNSDGVKNVVVFDPADKEVQIREWLPTADDYLPQQGNDLGSRLVHAFQFAFDKKVQAAIAIGSDTIGLRREFISKAFDSLDHYDVVLGPAKDGGYYLIGLSSPQQVLFSNIPWSTSEVFNATLAWIQKEGLSYYLLEQLEDLDEIKMNEDTAYGTK